MIIISVNSAHLLLVYFFNCWPLGQSVSIKIITKNGGWWWMKMFENRCEWMQRGRARTFFLLNFFPFQPFSFISDKNRLMKVPNSYFFLNIFKNRLKWIKNPNLHDSRFLFLLFLFDKHEQPRLFFWAVVNTPILPTFSKKDRLILNHKYGKEF